MDKKTFLASDETVNSYGFKVLTDGIDTTNFERNPIMLYMHERPNIIGRWENLKKEDGKLFVDAIFDTESEKGKEVSRQVENGFLRGVSIGIIELEKVDNVITKSELVEISIVDIGSNSNALKLYRDSPVEIRLSMNEVKASQTLVKALGLRQQDGAMEIIKAVQNLKTENTNLTTKYKELELKIKEEHSIESERLTALAVKKGIIPENLATIQKMAFENDFLKAKEDLHKLIDEHQENEIARLKHNAIATIVNGQRSQNMTSIKNTDDWTLNDYRRFAPEKLEKNPDLYKELIKKEYNK